MSRKPCRKQDDLRQTTGAFSLLHAPPTTRRARLREHRTEEPLWDSSPTVRTRPKSLDMFGTSPNRGVRVVKISSKWVTILQEAAGIVRGYDTGVTLRQLYYRLVALGRIKNIQGHYKDLSTYSAIARREGWFPELLDRTRSIHVHRGFPGPGEARAWLSEVYRRDRTEGQSVAVYVGVEKAGIVEQLTAWFGEYGVPILALGGY